MDSFEWRKAKTRRYQSIGNIARHVLAVLTSYIASDVVLSISGNLIEEIRTKLSDESIRFLMFVCDWSKLLQDYPSQPKSFNL